VTDALYSEGVMPWSVLLMEFSFARAGELLRWWRSANGMQEPSSLSYRAEDDMNLDGCCTVQGMWPDVSKRVNFYCLAKMQFSALEIKV